MGVAFFVVVGASKNAQIKIISTSFFLFLFLFFFNVISLGRLNLVALLLVAKFKISLFPSPFFKSKSE